MDYYYWRWSGLSPLCTLWTRGRTLESNDWTKGDEVPQRTKGWSYWKEEQGILGRQKQQISYRNSENTYYEISKNNRRKIVSIL